MWDFLRSLLKWGLLWLGYVLVICLAGALLGVISHLFYGWVFAASPDYGDLAGFGFRNGLKYGSVWAGGLSIVLCVVRARKEYLKKHGLTETGSV